MGRQESSESWVEVVLNKDKGNTRLEEKLIEKGYAEYEIKFTGLAKPRSPYVPLECYCDVAQQINFIKDSQGNEEEWAGVLPY